MWPGGAAGLNAAARVANAQPQITGDSQSGDYLAIAFRESPIPTTLTRTFDGVILDTNQAFCRLLGWELGDVIGQTSTSLGVWGSQHQRQLLLGSRAFERPFTLINYPLRRADGTFAPCAISI